MLKFMSVEWQRQAKRQKRLIKESLIEKYGSLEEYKKQKLKELEGEQK